LRVEGGLRGGGGGGVGVGVVVETVRRQRRCGQSLSLMPCLLRAVEGQGGRSGGGDAVDEVRSAVSKEEDEGFDLRRAKSSRAPPPRRAMLRK
jgi:hypothetical protein